MMKKVSKLMAMVLALFMVLSLAAPAKAADFKYPPVKGDNSSATFKKFLVVDVDARIPGITFEFMIKPGEKADAASGKMAVLAGVGTPKIIGSDGVASDAAAKAVFEANESASTTPVEGVKLENGKQKFAVKELKFDFSDVEFDEPGIYRYVVTETSSGQQGIKYDTQAASPGSKVRYLDVYVTDDETSATPTLKVSEYVLHETLTDIPTTANLGSGEVTNPGDAVSDKSVGFVNEMETVNLTFGKEVKGNQGSKDKYFEFTLVIGNAGDTVTYDVDITQAEATSGTNSATITANAGQTNLQTITTGADGSATVKFYLQDGQYITVKGLPKDATYTLTENAEDYKSAEKTDKVAIAAQAEKWTFNNTDYASESGAKAAVDAWNADPSNVSNQKTYNDIIHTPATTEKTHDDAISGTLGTDDIYTGFTNTRGGVIPTGVILAAVPGAILTGGALLYLFGKKRHEDEE